MTLLTPTALLEDITIDLLGELMVSKRGNRYLLVISDRYFKLVRTMTLKRITAAQVALAFLHHWVIILGHWSSFCPITGRIHFKALSERVQDPDDQKQINKYLPFTYK